MDEKTEEKLENLKQWARSLKGLLGDEYEVELKEVDHEVELHIKPKRKD